MRFVTTLSICLFAVTAARGGGGSPLQKAPPKAISRSNPYEGSQPARLAGAKLYQRECAACHGSNGEGRDTAPPLARSGVYQAPPGAVLWVLRNGSLYKGMPSFAHIPEPQLWQIVTYLRGLKSPLQSKAG